MIDQFVAFLNTQGVFVLVIGVLIYQYYYLKNKEISLHIIFSVIVTLAVTFLLKELFKIPRPFVGTELEAQAGLVQSSSLPSGHAAVAFALATTVTLHQKKLGVFLFLLASLIGIGRVLANVHYPIDIVIGIMIGVLVGIFFENTHFKTSKIKKK